MSPERTPIPLPLRVVNIIFSLTVLLWLPVEETTIKVPLLIAIIAGCLLVLVILTRYETRPCHRFWIRYPSLGILTGLGIPWIAIMLMLFKSGLHGHGFPDFTFEQYMQVLTNIPLLAGLGFLIGVVGGYWRWKQCS